MTYFDIAQMALSAGNRERAERFFIYAAVYGSPEEQTNARLALRFEFGIVNAEERMASMRASSLARFPVRRERIRSTSRTRVGGSLFSHRELDDFEIEKMAPAVFSNEKWGALSNQYKFFSTKKIVDEMRANGFAVVDAQQSNTSIKERETKVKHLLRFAKREDLNDRKHVVGDETPEIVLTNAHDGRASWQLRAGIFRLVCTNGMIVQSENFGALNVRHVGHSYEDVIEESLKIANNMPMVRERIAQMKSINLSEMKRREMANDAAKLLGKNVLLFDSTELLNPRRNEPQANSLWTTFNIIQENLIRGGVQLSAKDRFGSRRLTRGIKSIDRDISINSKLWSLAESFIPESA